MTKEKLIETIHILLIWFPFWITYKREYDTYGIIGMIIVSFILYCYGTKNKNFKINVNLVVFINIMSILFYLKIL